MRGSSQPCQLCTGAQAPGFADCPIQGNSNGRSLNAPARNRAADTRPKAFWLLVSSCVPAPDCDRLGRASGPDLPGIAPRIECRRKGDWRHTGLRACPLCVADCLESAAAKHHAVHALRKPATCAAGPIGGQQFSGRSRLCIIWTSRIRTITRLSSAPVMHRHAWDRSSNARRMAAAALNFFAQSFEPAGLDYEIICK